MDAYDTDNSGAQNKDEADLSEHDLADVAGGHTWPIEGRATVSSSVPSTEDNRNPPVPHGGVTVSSAHAPSSK
jgi:hypothetical protein